MGGGQTPPKAKQLRDRLMAARLKGTDRPVGRCELCLAYVNLTRLGAHVQYHK